MRLSTATPDEAYWRVRRQVILRHTGELPLEVRGPDAERTRADGRCDALAVQAKCLGPNPPVGHDDDGAFLDPTEEPRLPHRRVAGCNPSFRHLTPRGPRVDDRRCTERTTLEPRQPADGGPRARRIRGRLDSRRPTRLRHPDPRCMRVPEQPGCVVRTLLESDYPLGVADETRMGALRFRWGGTTPSRLRFPWGCRLWLSSVTSFGSPSGFSATRKPTKISSSSSRPAPPWAVRDRRRRSSTGTATSASPGFRERLLTRPPARGKAAGRGGRPAQEARRPG